MTFTLLIWHIGIIFYTNSLFIIFCKLSDAVFIMTLFYLLFKSPIFYSLFYNNAVVVLLCACRNNSYCSFAEQFEIQDSQNMFWTVVSGTPCECIWTIWRFGTPCGCIWSRSHSNLFWFLNHVITHPAYYISINFS